MDHPSTEKQIAVPGVWLTPWRLKWYPIAVLLALGLAFFIALSSSTGARSSVGRLGGDYPAFYAAGRILLAGDVSNLYSWPRQAAEQLALFPGEEPGGFLAFAYPPFVAAAFAPLALLPFRVSYALYTLACVGAVLGTFVALRPLLPRLATLGLVPGVGALLFHPLLRSVGGGQNTAVSLGLIGVATALAARNVDVAAGMCLGMLLFKPQLAVPLIAFFALAGRWRIALGAALVALALYALGAAAAGATWPLWWWREGVVPFQDHDQAVNSANSISWLGVAEGVLGVGDPVARTLGYGASVLTAGLVAWRWWKRAAHDLVGCLGLAVVGTVLVSPHAMFYDAGLLVIPLAIALDRGAKPHALAVAALWILANLHMAAKSIGFSPLFIVSIATLCLSERVLNRQVPSVFNPHE